MTQYGPDGFIDDLPELITGRKFHACAGYYNDLDHFVLLVVGGWTDHGRINSTEIFEVGVSKQWTEVSPLSKSRMELRASTVNNVIYLTGEDSAVDRSLISLFIF